MMNDFVAIDFETANAEPTSICAIGAVKVEGGVVTDRFYRLVKPEPDYYIRRFTECVHGIGPSDTDDAPGFWAVWPELRDFIGGRPLVAHNKRFDER